MSSEVRFGAFLVYSPRGESQVARRSRSFVRALKEDRVVLGLETASEFLARRFIEEASETRFQEFFGKSSCLVPVPRSALLVKGGLWPAQRLAQALFDQGLGGRVVEALRRRIPIQKSALAPQGQRPGASLHFETLEIAELLESEARVTLIDDVITRGATVLGAARRLWASHPGLEIRAFTAVRTLGLQPDIEHLIDPCIGLVSETGGEIRRIP